MSCRKFRMIHVQSARYFFGTDELIFSLPVMRCDMLHGALLSIVYRFFCTITVPFWRGDPEAYMELYELRLPQPLTPVGFYGTALMFEDL